MEPGARANAGKVPIGLEPEPAAPVLGPELPPIPAPDHHGTLEEAGKFAQAIAESASAELSLSLAAASRSMTHGFAALLAVFVSWSFLLVAALLALTDWFDSAAWAFALVSVLHLIVAGLAWKRRLLWQRRIGFARTRAALATVLGSRTPPA